MAKEERKDIMLDIKFVRENPDAVKENIKKKFQEAKLPLVDQVIALDAENRAAISEASSLRAERNALSKKIGALMGQAKKDPSKLEEAEAVKAQVAAQAERLKETAGRFRFDSTMHFDRPPQARPAIKKPQLPPAAAKKRPAKIALTEEEGFGKY